jgi:hypothetical protein
MKPVNFKESNKRLDAPKGMSNCSALDVFSDGMNCISAWKPSVIERIKILFGGKVWLGVYSGHTQPPVFVTADYPFEKTKQ